MNDDPEIARIVSGQESDEIGDHDFEPAQRKRPLLGEHDRGIEQAAPIELYAGNLVDQIERFSLLLGMRYRLRHEVKLASGPGTLSAWVHDNTRSTLIFGRKQSTRTYRSASEKADEDEWRLFVRIFTLDGRKNDLEIDQLAALDLVDVAGKLSGFEADLARRTENLRKKMLVAMRTFADVTHEARERWRDDEVDEDDDGGDNAQ